MRLVTHIALTKIAIVAAAVIAQVTCYSSNVVAKQYSGDSTSGQESVTFVLELDDDMIDALRRGEPLKSAIPAHLQNKVTEVRLRYVSSAGGDDRTASLPQQNRGSGNQSTVGNPYSSQNQMQNPQGQQGTQENQRSTIPVSPRTNNTQSFQNQPPTFVPPSQTSPLAPRQNNNSGFNGNQSSNFNQQNDTDSYGRAVTQYDRPVGPVMQQDLYPQTASTPRWNNGQQSTNQIRQSNLQQDQNTDQQQFQPIQRSRATGMENQRLNGGQYPAQPVDTSVRPRSDMQNQFDTVQGYRDRQNYPDNQDGMNQQPGIAQQAPQYQQQAPQYQQQAPYQDSNYGGGFRSNAVAADYPDQNQHQNQMPTQQQFQQPQFQQQQYQQQPQRSGNMVAYDRQYAQTQRGNFPIVDGHDVPVPNIAPRIARRSVINDRGYNPNSPEARIPSDDSSDGKHFAANKGGSGPVAMTQVTKMNSFLWFMLLCSFGLNLYLGWISRGFYVRYRELADELRDTFSTA